MSTEIIHYEVKVAGCVAELWLNDIPLARLDSREQTFKSVPAATFLQHGRNVLELVIEPGPLPSKSRSPSSGRPLSAEASAWARVAMLPVGAFAGDPAASALAELRLEKAERQTDLPMPLVLRREFEFQRPAAPWLWQTAELIQWEKDRPAILATIGAIHAAFVTGNAEPVIQRALHYLREEASVWPTLSTEALSANLRRDISRNASRTGWVAPLRPDEFDLRVCAGGRLVDCITRKWTPVIDTLPQPDGSIYPFPMFLGKHAGEWHILR